MNATKKYPFELAVEQLINEEWPKAKNDGDQIGACYESATHLLAVLTVCIARGHAPSADNILMQAVSMMREELPQMCTKLTALPERDQWVRRLVQ